MYTILDYACSNSFCFFFQCSEHRLVDGLSHHGHCSLELKYYRMVCGVRLIVQAMVVWAATLETCSTLLEMDQMTSL